MCTWNDKILLAKRAIEPRKGFWTLPAGYMELGETTEQAAQREAREEACATIEIDRLDHGRPPASPRFASGMGPPARGGGPEQVRCRVARDGPALAPGLGQARATGGAVPRR